MCERTKRTIGNTPVLDVSHALKANCSQCSNYVFICTFAFFKCNYKISSLIFTVCSADEGLVFFFLW